MVIFTLMAAAAALTFWDGLVHAIWRRLVRRDGFAVFTSLVFAPPRPEAD